jgi:hypothetical protein
LTCSGPSRSVHGMNIARLSDDAQLGFLLGLQATAARLDMQYRNAVRWNTTHTDPDDKRHDRKTLDGYREAYWTANHLLGETTAQMWRRNRPVWQRFKDMQER